MNFTAFLATLPIVFKGMSAIFLFTAVIYAAVRLIGGIKN